MIPRISFLTSFAMMLSLFVLPVNAQVDDHTAREQTRKAVRLQLHLKPDQFLSVQRDEKLEQLLAIVGGKSYSLELIYQVSQAGDEITENAIVHHVFMDVDPSYIVAISPVDGNIYRIRGFSDSLAEFEKLIMARKMKVLSPDQAEALADFYREVNPENRSIAAISSMFDLKQAAERQCQTIPFDAGDRQFEIWWKKAKTLYAGVPFSQTAVPREGGYFVGWTILSSPGARACAGAPLRAQLEVNSNGHIGGLSFLPLRPDQH